MFDRLVAALSAADARFRVIEHAPEGRSDLISAIRGNRPEQAAKAMVLSVRVPNAGRRHALAVLSGDRKVDFDAVAAALGGKKASFAPPEDARALTGCEMGAVPPFSSGAGLVLLADPDLLRNATLFFNAGRLDRSIEIDTADWVRVAAPTVLRIAL